MESDFSFEENSLELETTAVFVCNVVEMPFGANAKDTGRWKDNNRRKIPCFLVRADDD